MTDLEHRVRVRRAEIDQDLHDRLCEAIKGQQVQVFTDQRMLDFQGSPVHNAWDHLVPLLVLMGLALIILLTTGVAFGIIAMTIGIFLHLLSIKHLVAWRLRDRALAYLQQGAQQLNHLWRLGGVALVMQNSHEPPCMAPKGDWRRFVRKNLPSDIPFEDDMAADPDPAAPIPTIDHAQ